MKERIRTKIVQVARTVTEVEKDCPICGKAFWGRKNQRYCGRACQNKAYYQRHQEQLLKEKRETYHKRKQ